MEMKHKSYIISFLILALTTLLWLPSCTELVKRETAQRSAMPVFMIPRMITAGPFTLQAFERIHDKNGPAVVYIEGDGDTPSNPIATRMAAQDSAGNVIVLARPCQYRGTYNGGECPPHIIGSHRYSEQVITAYNNALNNIKATYDLAGFHLVGYGGGAAIATIVAAGRMDIASIRTVAGKLDPSVAPMTDTDKDARIVYMGAGSLNPRNYAQAIVTIPQRHFVGGKDNFVTDAQARSYMAEVINAPCVKTTIIDNANHNENWVEQWGELLKLPVNCE
jgi:starvation-inducible outer membrane lipoprotein